MRTAQQSGTPTLGVGPGNVPVYVHHSADVPLAARSIVFSKTFDNSTICGSEQAIVVEPRRRPPAAAAARAARARYFCTPDQVAALGAACVDTERRRMRAEVVGQAGARRGRARRASACREQTKILVGEPDGVGPDHPLSYEILAPVLAYYRVDDYAQAFDTCEALNRWGGVGHTVAVYANDERVVEDFATDERGADPGEHADRARARSAARSTPSGRR